MRGGRGVRPRRGRCPLLRAIGWSVNLSGGEPLSQPRFTAAVLELCKEAGFHTAVDTCGYAAWDTAVQVLARTDLVLFDLKHMDSIQHERLTGVPNELILQNAVRIRRELGLPLLARIPIVPGCNDEPENLRAMARFIAERLGTDTPVHLHPYHRLGEGKADALDRPQPISPTPPTDEQMTAALALFTAAGLSGVIGG